MDEKFLCLRRVEESDLQLLWEWRNDPTIRALSFSPEQVHWEHHVQWFASKLQDPNCVFFMVLDGVDIPIGQVRYDIKATKATISISLAKEYRGKGYGSLIIIRANDILFASCQIVEVQAFVKENNQMSYQALIKAGFKIEKKLLVQEQTAMQLILRRDSIYGK